MTSINRYSDGKYLGMADVDMDAYEAMAQQPEGLVAAGDILSEDDMERLGVEPTTTIYAE